MWVCVCVFDYYLNCHFCHFCLLLLLLDDFKNYIKFTSTFLINKTIVTEIVYALNAVVDVIQVVELWKATKTKQHNKQHMHKHPPKNSHTHAHQIFVPMWTVCSLIAVCCCCCCCYFICIWMQLRMWMRNLQKYRTILTCKMHLYRYTCMST